MTTHHQYLDLYPLPPKAESVIIGTIHPHDRAEFVMDFFYGSRCSIWSILAEAFPGSLPDPTSREMVLAFLERHKIGMSDTIRTCQRISNTALDAHLIPLVYNLQLVEQIKQGNVKKVFFTSGAGKNCALRTFYTGVLKYKYLPTEVAKNKEGSLPVNIFGRTIPYTVLYSPAATADRGIMKSKAFKAVLPNYLNYARPAHAYKVALYRSAFSELII